MSADVTALKRGKGGNSFPLHNFKNENSKRLDGLRLQQKVQEKALIPAGISRQEINIFT